MTETLCVVGLGYVGLHIAVAFAKSGMPVVGYDISGQRISELERGIDYSKEVRKSELKKARIDFTSNPKKIASADYVIMALPTTLNEQNEPELGPLRSASATVGKNLKKGALVILESSVYPGATEEIVLPILEKESGMKCPRDFKLAYSPERVNPGDRKHTLETIVKVVSGIDGEACESASKLYSRVVKAGTFKARSIKTAEAAKIIENIQRDINIALMNEFTVIFERLGISVWDVLEAAGTKWNFLPFRPGLVGGHCVPVNPFYLTYASRRAGYEPKVMLSGRETNNRMPAYIAGLAGRALESRGKRLANSKILVMGLTFKENISDHRSSPVKQIVKILKNSGAEVIAFDPNLARERILSEFCAESVEDLGKAGKVDCVVLCVGHEKFKSVTEESIARAFGETILLDTRGFFNKNKAEKAGLEYIGF